jgi:hypothetical protein
VLVGNEVVIELKIQAAASWFNPSLSLYQI